MSEIFDTRDRNRDESTDGRVVVVGAGPTGLMLAGDLAEAGVHLAITASGA